MLTNEPFSRAGGKCMDHFVIIFIFRLGNISQAWDQSAPEHARTHGGAGAGAAAHR